MEAALSHGTQGFPVRIVLLLMLWLIALPPLITAGNACLLEERNYLLDFKEAVVDKYKSLDSWQGLNCCMWNGVGCDFHTGHVTRLELQAYDLGGKIHSSLFQLAYLEFLDLSSNDFSDIPIPSDLGKLKRLTFLDMYGSGFSGPIPKSLINLTSLLHLDLSYNFLSAKIPVWFENLTSHLNSLYLSASDLYDSVPPNLLRTAERLQEIDIFGNSDLVGDISFIGEQRSSSLTSINLSGNKFTGAIPPSVGNHSALVYLVLHGNQLNGTIPPTISKLVNLKQLMLSSNSLSGVFPLSLLNNLTRLEALYLSDNHLTVRIDSTWIPQFDNLGYLALGSCNLAEFPPFLVNQYSLVTLDLSANSIAGGLPDSLCGTRMAVLDLSKNMLNNTIPTNFTRDCSVLEVFSLAGNHLEGDLPKEWGSLFKLRSLNLSDNHLGGAIPSSIAECQSLQVFDLGKNNFEGIIPEWIGNLSQLQILMLKSNKFQGEIPTQIIGLPNLQILDLSLNMLSGSIPSKLTKMLAMVNASQTSPELVGQEYTVKLAGYDILSNIGFRNQITASMKGQNLVYEIIKTNFKWIDLSNNNLSGGIPEEMGSLQGVIAVNLSRNNLSGWIPKTLGGMEQLESLDLSVNKLSGKIPLELQSLNYLEFLNLSFNMLEGKVPLGGQFLTFGESSYLSNSNISGIPFTNTTTTCKSFPCDGEGDDRENSDEEDDSDGEYEWWVVGAGLSYGLGFSIVIGVLTLSYKLRNIAFSLYDGLILNIFGRG
ncbi:putative leucine-rich repeat receptor-like serine/threonine-protein kinase At2g24130 [Cryptomeria japonica]|uniref:putative leucine-rich repeat receptor-like serine/threonine-protein kinase At2g24130 n=1 Tax=Cryptomeria japonica TaxID=3369 RepID=UPI0025AB73D8|nr:putative leucine-rich repeat receptor-like serine/threonine-protein kinase At2g24130 [Cryptomeria japonica]